MSSRLFTIMAGLITLVLGGFFWHVMDLPDESMAAAMVPIAKTTLGSPLAVKAKHQQQERLHNLLQMAQMIPSLALPTTANNKLAHHWGIKVLKTSPWENESGSKEPAQAILLGQIDKSGTFKPREIMYFLLRDGNSSGERWRVSGHNSPDFEFLKDLDLDNDGSLDGISLETASSTQDDTLGKNGILYSQLLERLQTVPEMQKHVARYLNGSDTRENLNGHLNRLWNNVLKDSTLNASRPQKETLKISRVSSVE